MKDYGNWEMYDFSDGPDLSDGPERAFISEELMLIPEEVFNMKKAEINTSNVVKTMKQ